MELDPAIVDLIEMAFASGLIVQVIRWLASRIDIYIEGQGASVTALIVAVLAVGWHYMTNDIPLDPANLVSDIIVLLVSMAGAYFLVLSKLTPDPEGPDTPASKRVKRLL